MVDILPIILKKCKVKKKPCHLIRVGLDSRALLIDA
jgi:hypothetical protein